MTKFKKKMNQALKSRVQRKEHFSKSLCYGYCAVFSSAGERPKSPCFRQVQSIVERVIVFLLSQVVDRSSEDEVLFSLHPRTESCKLLWRDGQVIGFYTVKHKGRKEMRMRGGAAAPFCCKSGRLTF